MKASGILKLTLLASILTVTMGAMLGCSERELTECDGFTKSNGTSIPAGTFKRVFTIVFENRSLGQVARAPFFRELAKDGALLNRFCGVAYDSQPNYIAMIAGSKRGVEDNTIRDIPGENIANLFHDKGLDWKVYADGYPGDCFLGTASGAYRRRHNPFISFEEIQNNPTLCDQIVSDDQLEIDVANDELPHYGFFIPDLDHSGHDKSIEFTDNWFRSRFSPLLKDPKFMKDTLFIITFDEGKESSNNRIYTVLVGDMVEPGTVSSKSYGFYNILKTIQQNFNLNDLGENDAKAAPITGIWQ